MTIVPTISMEDIPKGCTILYSWITSPSHKNDGDDNIMSIQIHQKLEHWNRGALAFGALINGLFIFVEPYDKEVWHLKKNNTLVW